MTSEPEKTQPLTREPLTRECILAEALGIVDTDGIVIDGPAGYDYVVVNGQLTIDHGTQTGAHSGQLLRNGRR